MCELTSELDAAHQAYTRIITVIIREVIKRAIENEYRDGCDNEISKNRRSSTVFYLHVMKTCFRMARDGRSF